MKLNDHDRLTFELVEAGVVTIKRRPLYEPGITRLLEAGLIREAGTLYEPVDLDELRPGGGDAGAFAAPGPAKKPRKPAMGQMQVRIPQAWIDIMVAQAEERGVDKSKVLRDLLRPCFEGPDAPALPVAQLVRPAPAPAPVARPAAARPAAARPAAARPAAARPTASHASRVVSGPKAKPKGNRAARRRTA